MIKKYLMREIVETEMTFGGTEEEIQEKAQQCIEYNKSLHQLGAYNIELIDDIDQYMEQMNVRWKREDLEDFLEENDIPPTEKNLKKYMEINPRLNYDCSYGWNELCSRFDSVDFEDSNLVNKYIVKNPDFTIEVREMWEDGEIVKDDEGGIQYEIRIDGSPYSNYIGEEEMEATVAVLLFKRDYEEVE